MLMIKDFYPLISQIILTIWLFIDYKTGKASYYEAVNAYQDITKHNKRKKLFNYFYILYALGLFVVNELSLELFKNSRFEFYLAPTVMTTLIVGISLASLFTDPPTHRVNRHSLRFVYFTNFIMTLLYGMTIPDGIMMYMLPVIGVNIVILYFLLFTNIMGASDLRAMMAFLPYYLVTVKNLTLYILVIHFMGIALGPYLQKRVTHKSVPICHWLLIPAPFFVILFTGLSIQFPELLKLLDVQVFH